MTHSYPDIAYADEGVLWWELDTWPGKKSPLGDEPRIAAWLAYNKAVGDTFTTDELREALGHRLSKTSRNDREHFQRRIRQLRSVRDGWIYPSVKHDRTIESGNYRLERVGWNPALGKRPKDPTKVSAKNRLLVLERDHYRCFHCGVISGEPYPEQPEDDARMTVGHVLPAEFGGSGEPSNLRAECALCNEASRSDTRTPETYESVNVTVNNLNTRDRQRLAEWIEAGRRGRDRVDEAYDKARLLSPGDRMRLAKMLALTTPR